MIAGLHQTGGEGDIHVWYHTSSVKEMLVTFPCMEAVLPCLATGALVLDVSSLPQQQFNNSEREGVSVSEAYVLV